MKYLRIRSSSENLQAIKEFSELNNPRARRFGWKANSVNFISSSPWVAMYSVSYPQQRYPEYVYVGKQSGKMFLSDSEAEQYEKGRN